MIVWEAALKGSGKGGGEVKSKGRNSRPLWSAVLTAVERERRLLTDILRAYERYSKARDGEEMEYMRGRSVEWVVEWKGAKGELQEEIERNRRRVQLPKITEEQRGKWRRMEKPQMCKNWCL